MKRLYDWFFAEPEPTEEELEESHRRHRLRYLAAVQDRLYEQTGREPTVAEVWEAAGIE